MSRKVTEKRQETVFSFGTYQDSTDKVYDWAQRVFRRPGALRRNAVGLSLDSSDTNGKSTNAEREALPWYQEALLRLRTWLAPHGNVLGPLGRTTWLPGSVRSGYALAVVERPGTGTSFAASSGFAAAMTREANEILNWMAAQKWWDGTIGRYGGSAQAQVQFAAVSTGHLHRKALLAESSGMDVSNSFMCPGGNDNSCGNFSMWSHKLLDSNE